MNCTVCNFYGKCPAWESDKKIFDFFLSAKKGLKDPMAYSCIFKVTKEGAQCEYFRGAEDDVKNAKLLRKMERSRMKEKTLREQADKIIEKLRRKEKQND